MSDIWLNCFVWFIVHAGKSEDTKKLSKGSMVGIVMVVQGKTFKALTVPVSNKNADKETIDPF